MYALYKPFRNTLGKHSTVEGLQAAFHFMQYLDHEVPLPQALAPPLRIGRMDQISLGIFQWEFELLIRELVLNGDLHAKKSIQSWHEIAKIMNMIKRIENEAWGSHSRCEDDILYELVRIAHRQFPWQRGINRSHISRYLKLYSNAGLRDLIVSDYGMTPVELFQISLGLTGHFLSDFNAVVPLDNQINEVSADVCAAFVERFSITLSDLKSRYREMASYDVNWAYTFNPLRQKPLIYLEDSRSVICPIPHFLIRRITNEMYFDLVSKPDAFSQHFGPAVQEMIGDVINFTNSSGTFDVLPEQRYGSKKEPKDTADWIVSDPTAHLFVECKGARIKFRGTSDLSSHEFIDAEFDRIRSFAFQLYKTLDAALKGDYPNWKPDGLPVYPIVVTLEDWQSFGIHVQRLVFDPLREELEKIGIDPVITTNHPLSFCALEDFEMAMNVANIVGISRLFGTKSEGEYPQWSMGTFLSQNFGTAISSRRSLAFGEEWDRLAPMAARANVN